MSELKQVIVVRKDLNMSTGKLAAQVAHASVTAVMAGLEYDGDTHTLRMPADNAINIWYTGSQTKIVVAVNSEAELRDIFMKAKEADVMTCSIIKDEGRTELDGPTYTAVAVGPWDDWVVDTFTGHLPLYR